MIVLSPSNAPVNPPPRGQPEGTASGTLAAVGLNAMLDDMADILYKFPRKSVPGELEEKISYEDREGKVRQIRIA